MGKFGNYVPNPDADENALFKDQCFQSKEYTEIIQMDACSLTTSEFVPSVGPVQSCWFLSPSAGASAVDLSAAAKHHRRVITNHRFLDSSHDFFPPDVNHRSEALVAE
ncbi:hypothetical protein AVEN_96800-1 [Araneus ventricosus]|uniref:Uncharacterized protein n=1 Tax=Araneus ventricosus TaxID=182803 RepID=A0A4Y2NKL9_ARAVE|nr:hypothetical protein AVEN_96800-1 [Araneus ventricosus]